MTVEAGRDGELNEWAAQKAKTSDGRERRGEENKGGRLRNSGEKRSDRGRKEVGECFTWLSVWCDAALDDRSH